MRILKTVTPSCIDAQKPCIALYFLVVLQYSKVCIYATSLCGIIVFVLLESGVYYRSYSSDRMNENMNKFLVRDELCRHVVRVQKQLMREICLNNQHSTRNALHDDYHRRGKFQQNIKRYSYISAFMFGRISRKYPCWVYESSYAIAFEFRNTINK